MAKNATVLINGVHYDAHTGLRVSGGESAKKRETKKPSVASHSVHTKAERTKTLSKRNQKQGKRVAPAATAPAKKPTRSPQIQKFASTAPAKRSAVISDIGPQTHKAQAKHRAHAQAKTTKQATPTTPPASVIKAKAISDAIATKKPRTKKKSFFKRHSRIFSLGTVAIVLLAVVGFITYTNLPTLSVKIAASQAGVQASYPSYQPAGYRLKQPVEFSRGEVVLNFRSTTSPREFSLKQAQSNWDSSALLENYVRPTFGDEYATYTDSGLTIYATGTQAAWVNSGILHTIRGTAELSGDQIRRLALSL